MYDIVQDNFTKTASSRRGSNAEEGERQRGEGYKLSEKTALKKSISFPSRGLRSTFRYNPINTVLRANAAGDGFELCTEHDQHTLRSAEGQEITALPGWGVLRQEFNSSKGKFKAFL